MKLQELPNRHVEQGCLGSEPLRSPEVFHDVETCTEVGCVDKPRGVNGHVAGLDDPRSDWAFTRLVPKSSHGAYREQVVLDARSVVHAPAGKTLAEASTLPMNGLMARLSLDLLKLSPGQVLAVTGVAGAYAGYVIQIAKTEGLTVIADASEKDEGLVASLGPTSS